MVVLAVQTGFRLIGEQVQRRVGRRFVEPYRMTEAIGIAETGNALRVNFDAPRRGRQGMGIRVVTKGVSARATDGLQP
jgi:hypothetical protein